LFSTSWSSGVVMNGISRRASVLVDVVADVDEEGGVVLDDPTVGREVAVLELRAADEAEAHLRGAAAERGRGARAADRARLAARVEAVPVLAIGLQFVDLDVDRVPVVRPGQRGAPADAAVQRLVVRDLPAHGDRARGQRLLAERVEGQARPQDDAVARRLARGDADGERIAAEAPAAGERGRCGNRAAKGQRRGAGSAGAQKGTAGHTIGQEIRLQDPVSTTDAGLLPVGEAVVVAMR
jgi:hypothetical protein